MTNRMIICAAFIPIIYLICQYLASSGQENFLLIGILSAQENFNLRNTQRRTWLRDLASGTAKYFFLIGKHTCEVPPEDRLDEYACKSVSITLSPDAHENSTFYSGDLVCDAFAKPKLYAGFSFITNHDIILEYFGIPNWKIKNQQVKIKLLDAISRKEVVSTRFSRTEQQVDVLWESTMPYLLPKGFEGIIVLEENGTEGKWKCGFNWSDSNILTFVHLIHSETERPISFSSHSLSPAVVGFKLKGLNNLRRFTALKQIRKLSWSEKIDDVSLKLRKEISEYNDVLLLDVVDVYRNLPQKMLLFFKWAYQNMDFSFLLKADDDTLVNIPLITKELQTALKNDNQISKLWWWSSFRKNWAVQSHGKWREDTYHSLTYPPFPCGAGYILNYNTVKFLGLNADTLYRSYQGEDVSLGIWLAAVNPTVNSNPTPFCVWVCDREDSHEGIQACNYPQLSSANMWNKYEQKFMTHRTL